MATKTLQELNDEGRVLTGAGSAAGDLMLWRDISTGQDKVMTRDEGKTAFGVTSKQDAAGNLTIFAGLVGAANRIPYFTGSGSMALIDYTTIALLASPAITGNPTVPTQPEGNNSTRIASTEYVDRAITTLVGTAPGVLNTLGEISDALNDDANLAATLTTAIGTKQAADGTLTAFAGLTITANSITVGAGADQFTQVAIAANQFLARSSTGNLVAKTITDQAFAFLDDTTAAAQRTTIGLGNVPNVDATNATNIATGTLNSARLQNTVMTSSDPTPTNDGQYLLTIQNGTRNWTNALAPLIFNPANAPNGDGFILHIDEDAGPTFDLPISYRPGTTPTLTGTSSDQVILTDGGITFGGSEGERTVTFGTEANKHGNVDVTLTIDDGTFQTSVVVQLVVDPVPDDVTITSDGGGSTATVSFDENSTAVFMTVACTNPDEDAVTYSISGGPDAAHFSINSSTGEVSPVGPKDFEAPDDADTNGAYLFTVRAENVGGGFDEQDVTANLQDVAEASPRVTITMYHEPGHTLFIGGEWISGSSTGDNTIADLSTYPHFSMGSPDINGTGHGPLADGVAGDTVRIALASDSSVWRDLEITSYDGSVGSHAGNYSATEVGSSGTGTIPPV